MTEDIEKILMQDELFSKHFVAKHPPKYKFNGEINPAFLGINPSLDYAFEWLKEYVGFPLLEDNLDSIPNYSRRDWRTELASKYGKEAEKFFKENKLRKNISLAGISGAMGIIDSVLGEEYHTIGEKSKELIKLAEEYTEKYILMNKDEKMAFARRVEDKVHEFLPELCAN